MVRLRALMWWGARNNWVLPLGIFAFSRLVESLLFAHLLGLQSGHPGLADGLANNWDGKWYRRIAEHGYPGHIPMADGKVLENSWAFYPLFPGLVRLIMVTGLSFNAASIIVSTICAAGVCCLLFRLVLRRAGRFTATMAVVGLTFAPAAVLFEAAYTESLALLLVLAALAALGSRRYGWFAAFTLLLAFTRAIAFPLVLVCAIHGIARWRSSEPFPMRERIKVALLAGGAAASFGLWPLITGLVTGDLNAYLKTQDAWAGWSKYGGASWLVQAFQFHFVEVVIGTVAIVAIAGWIALRRASAVWGLELRAWTAAYPLYIIAAVRPSSSIFRFLLLTVTPWWPAPNLSERVRSTRARLGVVAATVIIGLVLQYFWIRACFVIWPGRIGAA